MLMNKLHNWLIIKEICVYFAVNATIDSMNTETSAKYTFS